LYLHEVELDGAIFETQKEGIEQDVLLKVDLINHSPRNILLDCSLASNYELLALGSFTSTFKVVNLVMKLWWKP
jgi:hypothetical protein